MKSSKTEIQSKSGNGYQREEGGKAETLQGSTTPISSEAATEKPKSDLMLAWERATKDERQQFIAYLKQNFLVAAIT